MRRGRISNRMRNWDYSRRGFYFLTVCSKNREFLFGDIKNKNMILNEYGRLLIKIIYKLPKRFGIFLDCFCVMPNHVHLIIFLNVGKRAKVVENKFLNVGANRDSPVQKRFSTGAISNSNVQKRSELSKLVGFLKMNAAKAIHDLGYGGAVWQRDYYDCLIRNKRELETVRWYIKNNPKTWDRDRENRRGGD